MNRLTSREIHLVARPSGLPTEAAFAVVTTELREPADGEILVRNLWMSVDPYMRGRMRALDSYVEPFELGEPLTGECIGEVLASRHPDFQAGDAVHSLNGWRELWVGSPAQATRVDPALAPLPAYLGVLGMTGFTAYVGLLDIAALQPGETVFVSAAAGAVGSVACQIARLHDCKVVGSAGSAAKVAWLAEDLGVDQTIAYKEVRSVATALARAAPDGIDVYFDNVGGDHLEAALQSLNDFGRIAACGMISAYNQERPRGGPRNLIRMIARRITMRGFIVSDHGERLPDFQRDMSRWIAEGKIRWRETVHEGIESAPRAFLGLFEGENIGKMLVKLADDGLSTRRDTRTPAGSPPG
ncbi:MAG: NADP-dependent oxidoreductase [Candidatus Krumholzibacteriia bacterium]